MGLAVGDRVVRCSVLQRVAVCCNVLQRVAVCCSVLHEMGLAVGYQVACCSV